MSRRQLKVEVFELDTLDTVDEAVCPDIWSALKAAREFREHFDILKSNPRFGMIVSSCPGPQRR